MKKYLVLIVITCMVAGFKQKQNTWLALGDSITYLNDHPAETGNRVEKGYLTRVTEKLGNTTYINQGHNGWTAVRIATEIESLGLVKADMYSVFLGTNDWWGGKPLGSMADYKNNTGTGTFYGAYRIIVDKLKTLNADAQIVFITPMQRADFVYLGAFRNNAYGSYKEKAGKRLSEFADAILEIGKYEKRSVVDLYYQSGMNLQSLIKYKRLKDPATGAYKNFTYPFYTDITFNPDTDEYPYPVDAIGMTYDGLHPSDKGNAVIADMLLKVFTAKPMEAPRGSF